MIAPNLKTLDTDFKESTEKAGFFKPILIRVFRYFRVFCV